MKMLSKETVETIYKDGILFQFDTEALINTVRILYLAVKNLSERCACIGVPNTGWTDEKAKAKEEEIIKDNIHYAQLELEEQDKKEKNDD